jgi:hypothetical protein
MLGAGVRSSLDSLLERAGFEPSIPRKGRWRLRKFSRCRSFRLSGAEVRRRNAGRIGGFEEGEFEADGATKEVATQICLSRRDAVQLRAQKIN